MPRYNVAMDQTAFYARVVSVPRAQAKDRSVARADAIASARREALPHPETDDPGNPWDIGGSEVDTRFEGDDLLEGPDAYEVTVGVKLWATRSVDVDAPNGDAACDAALEVAVDPVWPGESHGWRLTHVEPLETCDPETDDPEDDEVPEADDLDDDEDPEDDDVVEGTPPRGP